MDSLKIGRRASVPFYLLLVTIIFILAVMMNIISFKMGVQTVFGFIMLGVYSVGGLVSGYLFFVLRQLPVAELQGDRIIFMGIPPKRPMVILFDDIIHFDKSHKNYLLIHYKVGEALFKRKVSYFSLAHPNASVQAIENHWSLYKKNKQSSSDSEDKES